MVGTESTPLRRFFVLMAEDGRYIDETGHLTWARSLALHFSVEDYCRFMDGRLLLPSEIDGGPRLGSGPWEPIEVDERGQSMHRREPVTG